MKPNRNKVVLVSALAAATLGVAGLAALAVPAGAGEQPVLPDVSAADLLSSVLDAQPPALAGSIEVDNALGLPTIPGLPSDLIGDGSRIRVWLDGDGRSRISVPSQAGEQTVVDDGTTVWKWESAGRTVTRIDKSEHARTDTGMDPAAMATELLELVRPTSTVAVDGTAEVAERPAYELVLAPTPTERTLLREIRVAIDSETRLPLRLVVLANGTDDPVFSIGFDELTVGPQDAALFRFTPPAGAAVTEPDLPHDTDGGPGSGPGTGPDGGLFGGEDATIVGDGWDTVIVTELPTGALTRPVPGAGQHGRDLDPTALLDKIGTPVSGPWGDGRLISIAVGSVIITEDGRLAVGAVPQQVLVEALSR